VRRARSASLENLNTRSGQVFRPPENRGVAWGLEPERTQVVVCLIQFAWEALVGRAILLLLLGVPIPVILLLALIWH